MSAYLRIPKIEIHELVFDNSSETTPSHWEITINGNLFRTFNNLHESSIAALEFMRVLGIAKQFASVQIHTKTGAGRDLATNLISYDRDGIFNTEKQEDTRPLIAYTFSEFDSIIEVKEYLVLAKDVQSAKKLYDAGYAMENDSWFLYDKSLQDAIALYGEPRPEVAIPSTVKDWERYCNGKEMK